MGEQASLGFDLTFGDILLHKLVQAYVGFWTFGLSDRRVGQA